MGHLYCSGEKFYIPRNSHHYGPIHRSSTVQFRNSQESSVITNLVNKSPDSSVPHLDVGHGGGVGGEGEVDGDDVDGAAQVDEQPGVGVGRRGGGALEACRGGNTLIDFGQKSHARSRMQRKGHITMDPKSDVHETRGVCLGVCDFEIFKFSAHKMLFWK